MKTLTDVYDRQQKLISLNKVHKYSTTLAPKAKQEQYYRLLLQLRKAEARIIHKRRENSRYASQLQTAKEVAIGIISSPIASLSITPVK